MVQARSNYKNTIRKKKFLYDKEQTYKLEKARFSNAKLYWKMLKGTVSNESNKSNLTTNDFQTYFKAVNDPESVFYQADEDVVYFNDK